MSATRATADGISGSNERMRSCTAGALLPRAGGARRCENHYHPDSKSLKFALTIVSSSLLRNQARPN